MSDKTRDVTVKVAYVVDSMQSAINAGINGFAAQLLAEAFGDHSTEKFPAGAMMFNYPHAHDKRPVWVIVSTEAPYIEWDGAVAKARIAELEAEIAALKGGKDG